MPIYEYECNICGNTLEKWDSFSSSSRILCPNCGCFMDKIISSSTFVLKGGGWYSDGYSKKEKE